MLSSLGEETSTRRNTDRIVRHARSSSHLSRAEMFTRRTPPLWLSPSCLSLGARPTFSGNAFPQTLGVDRTILCHRSGIRFGPNVQRVTNSDLDEYGLDQPVNAKVQLCNLHHLVIQFDGIPMSARDDMVHVVQQPAPAQSQQQASRVPAVQPPPRATRLCSPHPL